MHLYKWTLATCLTLGLAAPALAAPAGFTASDWARLDKGEIVITTGTQQGSFRLYQAAGTVNGKPEQVYRMLTDFDNHTKVFSKVAKSYVKQKLGPTTMLVYKDLDLPWPLSGKWNLSESTLRPDINGYEWHSVDGNVGKQKGRYEAFTRKGKTVVLYQIWYDLSSSSLPRAIFDQAQRMALPGVIQDCRRSIGRY